MPINVLVLFLPVKEKYSSLSLSLSLFIILNSFILLLSTQPFQFYQLLVLLPKKKKFCQLVFFAFLRSLFIKSNFFYNQLITLGKILRTATVEGLSFEHEKVCVSTPPTHPSFVFQGARVNKNDSLQSKIARFTKATRIENKVRLAMN